MKAIVFGPSSTLRLDEIDIPVPADDEVLIKVRASSVNPLDAHMLETAPIMRNIGFKVLGFRAKRLGADIAGEVESVGRNVTKFVAGDAVFGGSGGGGFAEYACSTESRLSKKPSAVDFESAAGLNVAARTALQGLRDIAGVQPGQKVLINGASGGIGTFAVQIAKWLGAEVTGVCSTRNLDLVRSLGADHVTDYTCEDFSKGDAKYDVIFDLVADKPLATHRRVLGPRGKWIGAGVLGGEPSIIRMIAGMFHSRALSLITDQQFKSFMTKSDKGDLTVIGELAESAQIKTVIDRTYSLHDVPEAVRYVAGKHARGKVVISIGA